MSKKSLHVYTYKDHKIYADDILNVLVKLGVKKGDVLMVHSDLSIFGRPPEKFLKNRDVFLNTIINIFKQAVGREGTVIMPTFSYSFLKGDTYNVTHTPALTGVLPEHFRKQNGVIRTENPNLSFAVWGKDKKFFTQNLGKNSFGTNSVFELLHKKSGKIVLFGASFKGGTTFVHYIEHMHGVPYRSKELFYGRINNGEKDFFDEYEHDVRDQDRSIAIDGDKFEQYMKDRNVLSGVTIGGGRVQVVDAVKYFSEGTSLLNNNAYSFLHDDFHTRANSFLVPININTEANALLHELKSFLKQYGSNLSALNKYLDDIRFYSKRTGLKASGSKQPYRTLDFAECSVPGLDTGEVIFAHYFVAGPDALQNVGSLALAILVYKQLRDMPIELKYSYRFIFLASTSDSAFFSFYHRSLFPKTKLLLAVKQRDEKLKDDLGRYLDLVNMLEHYSL